MTDQLCVGLAESADLLDRWPHPVQQHFFDGFVSAVPDGVCQPLTDKQCGIAGTGIFLEVGAAGVVESIVLLALPAVCVSVVHIAPGAIIPAFEPSRCWKAAIESPL